MMNSRLVWRNMCNWMAVAITVSVLAACGGGSTKSTTAVVNDTVESVGTVTFGELSTFKITGSNLRTAYVTIDSLNSDRCEDLTVLIKTNNEIVFQCIPNRLSVQFDIVNADAEAIKSVYATVPDPNIQFDSVSTATTAKLGAYVLLNIDGEELLNTTYLPTSDKCLDLSAVSNTKTRIIIQCIPTELDFTITLTSLNDNVIDTKTVNLPSTTEKEPLSIIITSTLNFDDDNLFQLDEVHTYAVKGYLEGSTAPTITVANSDDCTGLEVTTSTAAQLIFTCTPTNMSSVFQIRDKDGNAIGDPLNATILVRMETSLGTIDISLKPAAAPITVANFLQYVYDDYYTDTIFHRLTTVDIDGIAVNQGGAFTSASNAASSTAKSGYRDAITLEPPSTTGLSNTINTIAMARGSELNTATSQFFFNVVDNTDLDTSGGGYAVFGEVISGASILQTINSVERSTDDSSVPADEIVIESVAQIQE